MILRGNKCYRYRVLLALVLILLSIVTLVTTLPILVQAGGSSGGGGSGGSVGGGPVPAGPPLIIEKTWEPGMQPREVTVQLMGKKAWLEWLVEEVVLNESNGYRAVVQDTNQNFPEDLVERPDKNLNDFLYIKEVGVNPADVEVDSISVTDTQFSFSIQKKYGYFPQTTDVAIKLHNEITGQVITRNMTYTAANWYFGHGSSWRNTVDFTATIPGYNPFCPSYYQRDWLTIRYYKNSGSSLDKGLKEYDIYLSETGWGGLELSLPETNYFDYESNGREQDFIVKNQKEPDPQKFAVTILNKKPQPTQPTNTTRPTQPTNTTQETQTTRPTGPTKSVQTTGQTTAGTQPRPSTRVTKPREPNFSTIPIRAHVSAEKTSQHKILPKTTFAPGISNWLAVLVLLPVVLLTHCFIRRAKKQ